MCPFLPNFLIHSLQGKMSKAIIYKVCVGCWASWLKDSSPFCLYHEHFWHKNSGIPPCSDGDTQPNELGAALGR